MRFSQATRNNFSAQSSGVSYATKCEAILRFERQLPNATALRTEDVNSWHGHNGRQLVAIVKVDENSEQTDQVVGSAFFTWHLYEATGRWEIVGYIA